MHISNVNRMAWHGMAWLYGISIVRREKWSEADTSSMPVRILCSVIVRFSSIWFAPWDSVSFVQTGYPPLSIRFAEIEWRALLLRILCKISTKCTLSMQYWITMHRLDHFIKKMEVFALASLCVCADWSYYITTDTQFICNCISTHITHQLWFDVCWCNEFVMSVLFRLSSVWLSRVMFKTVN